MALAIVLDAERSGRLRPGQTVVEATSGNTGIAFAMVCAARGYPFVAFISDNFSVERRKLMRAYGAKVVLTPAAEGASGRVRAAQAYADRVGGYLANQYGNPANPQCHRDSTAAEIVADFRGRPLHWFVSGWGSGGTLTGIGSALKAARPGVKVIAAEPESASLLAGGVWSPHKIQGWAPNFIPDVLDRDVADEIVSVTDSAACAAVLELARNEGILCGISSGATLAAALEIARRAPPGDVVLAMLPDTGERYLSTSLFESVHEGSDVV
jgi:cysteine synthase A